MKEVLQKRFITDCGKNYLRKAQAISHESICRCWTNPNLKTCVTCKFGELVKDSNGMEDEPQYLETWKWWNCKNREFDFDTMFTQASGDNTKSLCINCPKHEVK